MKNFFALSIINKLSQTISKLLNKREGTLLTYRSLNKLNKFIKIIKDLNTNILFLAPIGLFLSLVKEKRLIKKLFSSYYYIRHAQTWCIGKRKKTKELPLTTLCLFDQRTWIGNWSDSDAHWFCSRILSC